MIATQALSLLCGVLLGIAQQWLLCTLPLPAGVLQLGGWLSLLLSQAIGGMAIRVAAWLLAGMLLSQAAVIDYQHLRWSQPDAGRCLFEVTIAELPMQQGADWRFAAKLRTLPDTAPCAALPGKRSRGAELRWPAAPALRAGERWQLLLELAPPVRHSNPGRLAGELAEWRSTVHAVGRVVDSRLNRRLAPAQWSLGALRAAAAAAIQARVDDRDAAALITALAVGDTRWISRHQWQVYNVAGITHLVAISGLHVTLFSLIAAALARRLWSSCRALQGWRRDTIAAVVGVIAAAGYALLAGFPVPAQRTLIMLASWYALRLSARPAAAAPVLAVSAIAVLLFDPLSPLDAGFWLSFAATAVLLHAQPVRGPPDGWRGLLATQWRVSLGLLPICVLAFGSVSLLGLAVNLLAIPLFNLLLVPLILLGLASLAFWPAFAGALLDVLAAIHAWLWPLLVTLTDWPLTVWHPVVSGWWVLLAALASAWLLLPWRPVLRLSALLLLIPACWPRPAIIDGAVRLVVLDVGRGLAVLVRTAGHTLLYDNGETWGSAGSRTENWVIPALRAAGVQGLDAMVMPALDRDRAAGMVRLMAAMSPQWLVAAQGKLPPEFTGCRRGARWFWNAVQFRWLDERCSLLITTADGSTVVLPNVAAAMTATQLAEQVKRLDALILGRPLPALTPHWVVLSQSLRDQSTPAAQRATDRWCAAGTEVWTTADVGAVELRVGDGRIWLRGRRHTKPYSTAAASVSSPARFWQGESGNRCGRS